MAFNEIIFSLQELDDICGLTPEQRTAVELQMCVSLASIDRHVYWNFKYPRNRNWFGVAQVMSGEFVVRTVPIEYINQEILWWRDESFGINQTTGCYARGLAQLIDNGVLIPNTVKTRQRYTSVRFRFLPGILANLNLKWETGEPRCEDLIAEPNDEQGAAQEPRNHQHPEGDRPSEQGGDNDDPTVNDGMPYEDESDRPPYAELLPPTVGQWYGIYSGFNPGCATTYTDREYALPGATSALITPVVTEQGSGSCGGQSKNGQVTYNGNVVDTPRDYTSYTVVFRPA